MRVRLTSGLVRMEVRDRTCLQLGLRRVPTSPWWARKSVTLVRLSRFSSEGYDASEDGEKRNFD